MPDPVKLNAIKNLRAYDHAFISEAGVESFVQVFGLTGSIKPHKVRANPEDMKGLTLKNGARSARGMDAALLAGAICKLLDVRYMAVTGRGAQLRLCCDALEAHFSK
jgi:hypothetical protein